MRRVKTVAALAALVAATGCAASAAAAPRDDPTVSAAPIAAAAPVVSTNAAVMRGHGALAFVSHHELYLLRGSGLRTVDLPGRATKPMWSHDSRWLAVSVSPAPPKSNPYQPEPTSIWLVSAAGKVVRRLAKCGFGTTGSWSPTADRLEVTCDSDKRDAVEVVGTGGAKTHIVSANEVSGAAWSPDGARIAAGVARFDGSPGGWHGAVALFAAKGGGTRRTLTSSSGNVLEVAGWWPDGSGVLMWLDYQGSGSLAADGLPLFDVSVASGHRRQLAKTMLQYPEWLATSKARDEVAFIAGGDRYLTGDHKHLVICSRTTCHAVAQPKGRVSFDPAWSPGGRLAIARDRAIKPPSLLTGYTAKVDNSGGIDLLHTGDARAIPAGSDATDPVWGRGGSMLVVRGHSLYLLGPALEHADAVAGPIDGSADSYYGHVPWHDSFAWSEAVR